MEGRLDYGFFAGTTVRDPTDHEVEDLLAQTADFYLAALQPLFPSLGDIQSMSLVDSETLLSGGAAELPVRITFEITFLFVSSPNSDPTKEEVVAAMQDNVDYTGTLHNTSGCVFLWVHNSMYWFFLETAFSSSVVSYTFSFMIFFKISNIDYIQNYVWASGEGLFFDTQSVFFNAMDGGTIAPTPTPEPTRNFGTLSPSPTTAFPTSQAWSEPVQHVKVEFMMDYGFFQGTNIREPTVPEFRNPACQYGSNLP